MDAMATGAVGGASGPVLHRQAVIAFKEGLDAIGREAVFGVDALGRVTLAAEFFGDFGDAAFKRLDLMFGMAVRACRGLADPFSQCFAMHALLEVLRHFVVTFTASRSEL